MVDVFFISRGAVFSGKSSAESNGTVSQPMAAFVVHSMHKGNTNLQRQKSL